MAAKPKKKPASKKPAKAAPKQLQRKAAPKRAEKPVVTEHSVVVASVGVSVTYGRDRSETFELRGTASLNASTRDELVRTTGFVALASGKGASRIEYTPASLDRNLVFALFVNDADLALLREIFVTGTGSELSDPALTVWVRTAKPLKTDVPDSLPVLEDQAAVGLGRKDDLGDAGDRQRVDHAGD